MEHTETSVRAYLGNISPSGFLEYEYDELLEEHGHHFHLWLANDLITYAEHMDNFAENFEGEYESLADYVEQFEKTCGDLGRFAVYIDWVDVAKSQYACNGWYTIKTPAGTHLVFNK